MKNLANPTQTLHFAFHLSDYKYIAECRVFVLNPTRTLHKTLHKVIRITLHRGVQNRAQNPTQSASKPYTEAFKVGCKNVYKNFIPFLDTNQANARNRTNKNEKNFSWQSHILSVTAVSPKPQRLSRSKAE